MTKQKRNLLTVFLITFVVIAAGLAFKYAYALAPAPASTTSPKSAKVNGDSNSKDPTSKPAEEVEKPITLSFTGDILLDKSVGQQIDRYGVDYPFTKVSSLLKQSDITAGNLETSVSVRGTPAAKQFTFRSKPETLQGLVNSGYDMVSLANNHTLDYGVDALTDTIHNVQKYNLGYSGAGTNEEEAFKAYSTKVNGKKVSIIALSRVLPNGEWFARGNHPGLAHAYEYEPMLSYVKNTVSHSDYTIVMIHWNKERADYPEPYAREMAQKFIDAGVSAVIGGHSHSLMGVEYYKDAPIFYSLGNFVFTNSSSPKGSETMVVNLTLDKEKVAAKITPAKIIEGQPNLMDETYNSHIRNKISQLSYNAQVNENGEVVQTP